MYVSFHLIKMPWLKDGNDDDVDEQPRFAVKNTHYWNVAIYSLWVMRYACVHKVKI